MRRAADMSSRRRGQMRGGVPGPVAFRNTPCDPPPPIYVRIRQHEVPDQIHEVVVRRGEGAQRADGGAVAVELFDGHALRLDGPSEVGELLVHDVVGFLGHRVLHPRLHLDVGIIEEHLPLVGDGHAEIPADQLRPVHVVPIGCGQQPSPVALLPVDLVRLLDGCDAGPVQVAGVNDDVLLLGDHLEPVVQPPDHDRTDRGHIGDGLPFLGAPVETALHRLGDGDGLGNREADRGVDVDPVVGGLLDGRDTGLRDGQFHLDVRREAVEVDCLLHQPVGVPVPLGIGLDGEPTAQALPLLEDRQEHLGSAGRRPPRKPAGRSALRPKWGSRR